MLSAAGAIPVPFRPLLFISGRHRRIPSSCLAERTDSVPRKDKIVAAVTRPFTIAPILPGSCPGRLPQMSGDSVVQLLVVDGPVGRVDEGLLVLALDVELRTGYSFLGIWTFRDFWRSRLSFAFGHDGIAQRLLCRAQAGWLRGLSGAPSVSKLGCW